MKTYSILFLSLLASGLLCSDELNLSPGGESEQFASYPYRKIYEAVDRRTAAVAGADVSPYLSVHALMALLDNTAEIFSRTSTPTTLILRNVRKTFPKNVFVIVKLPDSIQVVGVNQMLKLIGKQSENGKTAYRFELQRIPGLYVWKGSNAHGGSMTMLLRTDLPPGPNTYPMEYWLEYENTATVSYTTYLKIASVPEKVAPPKIFRTGINAYLDVLFDTPEAAADFTKFYTMLGFNSFSGPTRATCLMSDMKKAGMDIFTENWFMHNGYNCGFDQAVPPEVSFIGKNGKKVLPRAICPVAVYQRGEFFRNKVEKYIEETFYQTSLVDNVMPNWEPEHSFNGKGCFCDRCREEFIKFSKLPREKILAAWPDKIQSEFKDQWIHFRSWQHGQVMKTVNTVFLEMNKKYKRDIRFFPLINYASMLPEVNPIYLESNPRDYIDDLENIEAWGPYIYQHYTSPWNYRSGVYLASYFSGDLLRSKYPGKKLLAFPIGALFGVSTNYYASPEGIAFETLGYFVNGWYGSLLYRFPQGYDARYWKSMSETNRLIALHEDTVCQGTPDSEVKWEALTPMPSGLVQQASDRYNTGRPECFKSGLGSLAQLQGKAFDHNGKTVLALGNFWQRGEVFVNVKFQKAESGKKYVLRELALNRCFGNASGSSALDGKELQQGVTVHVGGLRWAFFTLEPFVQGQNYGEILSPHLMNSEMVRRERRIREEYEFELDRRFSVHGSMRLSTSSDGMCWHERESASSQDKRLNAHTVELNLRAGGADRWAQLTFRLPNRLALDKQEICLTVTQPALFIPKAAQECTDIRYLSDPKHRPFKAEQQHYQIAYDIECYTDKPIALRNNSFKYGIGVHAPSKLTFRLDPAEKWQYFTAFVGLSNWSVPSGSAVFKVYVDGKLQFDSGMVTMNNNPVPVCVNVNGARELILELSDADDGVAGDFGSWADACLRRKANPAMEKAKISEEKNLSGGGKIITGSADQPLLCTSGKKDWNGGKLTVTSDGVFSIKLPFGLLSTQTFPVDTAKKYVLSGEFRVTGAEKAAPFYFAFEPFASNGQSILPLSCNPVFVKTPARLAEGVKKGDTRLRIIGADGWTIPSPAYFVAFDVKPDFSDLPNFHCSPGIRKGGVKTLENGICEVELQKPMTEEWAAGTPVRCHAAGPMFIFTAANGKKPVTLEWQIFRGVISGVSKGLNTNQWRPGTVRAGLRIFCSSQSGTLEMRNVKVEEEQ